MLTPRELNKWFADARCVLETAYLAHTEPWRQSGMFGPEARWIALRKPVADCIDRPGSFLDVGCANGYLLECCIKWTAERGIAIEPYGVDISAKLIDLAIERLPQFATHLFVANAFTWIPPIKFDFVRTELVYVPGEYERPFIDHLLTHYLRPNGRLLVANYGEDHPNPEEGLLTASHPTKRILERLTHLGLESIGHKDGYDPVKGRRTRIAILARQGE